MKDTNKEYLGKEGYDLMGAVFEVHRELGCGLSEQIYQESLEWELGLRAITFKTKSTLKVYYKTHLLSKRYIPDLHVFDQIMVELKAVKALTSEHEQQLLNYMHITKKAFGYLINFRPTSVEWKRYSLAKFIPPKIDPNRS